MRIPSRSRLVVAIAMVVTAGVVTGFGAAGRIGPFHALGAAPQQVTVRIPPPPLSAAALYPSPTQPATVHKIIEIQDPPIVPPSRPVPPPTFRGAQPTWPPTPSPTTPPTSAPSSTPCPDDCEGGGGDN